MLLHLLLLLAMCCIGASLLFLLKPRLQVSEILGLAFPVGSFLVTFSWFILSWKLTVPISNWLGFATILFGVGWFLFLAYKNSFFSMLRGKISKKPFTRFSLIVWIIIVFLVGESLFVNIVKPIYDWDALTLYDFRAQVVAESGSVATDAITHAYFLGYPFYTTLGHVGAYIFNTHESKLWYSLVYVSMILAFYGLLRRKLSQNISSFGALLLAVHPTLFGHAHVAYTNLSYALFYGLSVLYFFAWLSDNKHRDLIICSVLLAASAWVRIAEPFHLVILVSLVLSILFLKRSFFVLLSIVPVYAVRLIWQSYRGEMLPTTESVPTNAIESSGSIIVELIQGVLDFSRATEVMGYLHANVLQHYWAVAPALLLALIISVRNKSYPVVSMFIVLFLHLGLLYAGTLYFSLNVEYWKEIPDSLARMSMFLIPIVYFLAFTAFEKKIIR